MIQPLLRHAVIGAGFGLNHHVPAFNALNGVEVVAVADSGSGRSTSLVRDPCLLFSDWRKMLLAVRPDSISVATPPQFHKEIVITAIEQGIHVLCEKPFGLSVREAELMCDAQAKSCCVGSVGFQYRYENGLSLMKQLIQKGAIGELRRIDVAWITSGRSDPSRPWSWQNDIELGGGVINAFFSHVLDFIPWLANSQLVEIYGMTHILINERKDLDSVLHEVTGEDMVDALGSLENGVVFSSQVTNCQRDGIGMRIEAYGDLGYLNFQHRWPFTPGDASLTLRQDGKDSRLDLNSGSGDSRFLATQLLVSDFFQAIKSGNRSLELPVFEDGLRVRRNIEKLFDSTVAPV